MMKWDDISNQKKRMDSHEDRTAPEERSITTDASPSAVQPASTEPISAEAHMGVHQLSTSRIQMEMLPLRDYITDLSKEEWDSFSDAMINPVTKAHFLEVCLIVAKHVTLSALKVIMPSLARRLGEDPEFLMAPDESHGYVNVIGTRPKNPSIIYIEDDLDVIKLKKGVLTKVISKAGSRSSLRSCDEPLMSSRSSSGKRSSTSLQTTSLPQHGITKDHILRNVQRSLTKLTEAGLTPDSEEWIDAIVTEVTQAIDSTFNETSPDLQSSSRFALSLQKIKSIELMKNISLKLKTYMAQQHKPSKKQTSSLVEDIENNSILVSTTAEAMTTIIQEMETCLDGNDKTHPTKKLLATMKRAVKMLACQSVSSKDILALGTLGTNDLGELNVSEKEKLGQNSGQGSSIALDRLSSDQFRTKAKKAISDVLTEKVKVVHSTSSAGPCFPSGSVLKSNIIMEDKDLFSSCSPHPVHSVGSMIVDAFVEEITSIIESTECARESLTNEETASDTQFGESSVVPITFKNQTVEAAKGLYNKVQRKIGVFFKNPLILWHKSMSIPDIEKIEALQVTDAFSAQNPQYSGVQPTSTCSEQLQPHTRPFLRKTHSDGTHSGWVALGEFNLNQTQIDECTKEALKGILTPFWSKESEEPSLSLSTSADTFVENVIFQLDDLISSTSSMTLESSSDQSNKNSFENVTRTSDSTSRKSSSLACLQKMSSERFQTNALRAVSEAVLKTVRSHNASGTLNQHYLPERVQVSSFFFLPVEREASDTEAFEQDRPNVDVDSAASIMADQFVTDLQSCVESLHSMKDKPHKGNFFSTVSKLHQHLLNKMEEFFGQISFKGIRSYEQLVKEPTDGQSSISEVEHPPSEEHNIHPLVDPKDTTKDILIKVFTLYKDEMMGENAECDISPAVSTEDQNIILQLEAYFAESPVQKLGDEDYTDETVPSPTKLSQKLSEDEFQSKAEKLVSDVLLLAVRTLTYSLDSQADPHISSLEAQNAASDLVKQVSDVVQKLLEATASETPESSYDMKDCTDMDIQPSHSISQTSEDAIETIWSNTCKTFQSFKRKLKKIFSKYRHTQPKSEDEDKEAINKAFGFILEELAQSVDLDEDHQMIRGIVNAMIDNIGEEDVQLMKEPQRANSSSSTASKSKLSTLSSEVLPGAVLSLSETPAEAPPVHHLYIDMGDMAENEPSPMSHESIVNIVNTISAELNVQNEDCSLSLTQDLTSVGERLERLLCDERLSSLSHNLANLIHHLCFKDQKGMAATKSASDSLLLSMGQSGKFPPKNIVRQIVQVYAEETVKHLFLPCFNIPSPWNMDVEGVFQHASSSASCPSFLHSLSEIVPQGALRSPSQILHSTLQVLTTVMTRDVMNMLAPTLQTTGDLKGQTDQQPVPQHLFGRPCSGDPTQISVSKDIVMGSPYPSLNPVDSTSDDYTSLVTVLIIRLLSKLNDQESLSDDMLDICRVLINRVITEIDAALGIAKSMACLYDVTCIKKVFRAVYNDLMHEFGSKDILLNVMMSEDPCFEKSLVTSLTREFMQTTISPNLKEEKTKKRTLSFLPKLSKIKAFFHIKKSKSGSSRKEQSINVDQNPTSAHVDPAVLCAECLPCGAPVSSSDKTITIASSEKNAHKGFFSRIISSLSRKSPKIHPEALH
ncbi:uncharacterized protein LOC121695635 isoform X1 [Alosa sapidissima]|uniref:uncharacterized protein LOC121695635 isoform X1 n=4 Tax=Alosa sapidissima TaxID=34773 RepID=UPI001C091890|nr:uncharacterized protein LOC121695635 isoform X1 [Alosa sapidissima]